MSLRVGALLAALVAGPPLYALVQTGQLDPDTALTRVLLVAVALAVGVSMIGRIAKGYAAQTEVVPAEAPPAAGPAKAADPARD